MVTIRLCKRCRNAIPETRLELLPDTVICVACSKEIGGEYVVRVVRNSVGKAGSLKKNYSDCELRKTRKRIEPKEV
jgi:hypothetical protein